MACKHQKALYLNIVDLAQPEEVCLVWSLTPEYIAQDFLLDQALQLLYDCFSYFFTYLIFLKGGKVTIIMRPSKQPLQKSSFLRSVKRSTASSINSIDQKSSKNGSNNRIGSSAKLEPEKGI